MRVNKDNAEARGVVAVTVNGIRTSVVEADSGNGWVRVPVLNAEGEPTLDEAGNPITQLHKGDVRIYDHASWHAHVPILRINAEAMYMLLSELIMNEDVDEKAEEQWRPVMEELDAALRPAPVAFVLMGQKGVARMPLDVYYTQEQAQYAAQRYEGAIESMMNHLAGAEDYVREHGEFYPRLTADLDKVWVQMCGGPST